MLNVAHKLHTYSILDVAHVVPVCHPGLVGLRRRWVSSCGVCWLTPNERGSGNTACFDFRVLDVIKSNVTSVNNHCIEGKLIRLHDIITV